MDKDYDFVTDVTINKVYEGKSGESQYGKWTAYSFYVEGDDRKFSYFKTEKSPLLPTVGMMLKMLRFETVQKGQYTNYNVKEMFLYKEGEKMPKPTRSDAPQSTNSLKDISFYVSYAKDTAIALIQQFPEQYNGATLEQICDQITFAGQRMCKMATGQGEPITDDIEIPKLGLNPDDDYPAFDESTF